MGEGRRSQPKDTLTHCPLVSLQPGPTEQSQEWEYLPVLWHPRLLAPPASYPVSLKGAPSGTGSPPLLPGLTH
jgi:hypothetical protein